MPRHGCLLWNEKSFTVSYMNGHTGSMKKRCFVKKWRKSRKMRIDDQVKLINAGFHIIRKDDYPSPRIKMCTGINGGWKTYKKFETKAERDRTFTLLLKDDKIIVD